MHSLKSVCLLSAFLFFLYLRGAFSSYTERLRNNGSGLNYFSQITRGSIINSHRLRRQNDIGGGGRNNSIAKPTSVGISVTSPSDNGRNMKTQIEWRSKYLKQNRVLPAGRIFSQGSIRADTGTGQSVPSNNSRNVNVSADRSYPNTDEFDIAKEITYRCWWNDCKGLLDNSFCGSDFRCRCFQPYVFDGENCQDLDNIMFCNTHVDCFYSQQRGCFLVESTGDKICKCNDGTVFDNYRCLRKAEYLGACVSDKQCPSFIPCTQGICRRECPIGYIWLYDRCIEEHPFDTNKDSFIITHFGIILGIIGGIILVMLFIGIAVFLRRRYRRIPSQPDSNNSSSTTEGAIAGQPFSSDDQPPSYDEVMSASTLTLPRNAEEVNEDLPPSYRSGEEDLRNHTASSK